MAGRNKHQKEMTTRALNHQSTTEGWRKDIEKGKFGKEKNYIEKSSEENGIKKEEARKHQSRDASYVVARGLVIEVTKERYGVLRAGILRQETGIIM